MTGSGAGSLTAAIQAGLAGCGIPSLSAGVQRLMTAYRSGEVPEAPVMAAKSDAAAYAAYRMPATAAATGRAVRELRRSLPGWAPATLLDFGAGTGGAAWAVADELPSVTSMTLLEQSAEAIRLGSAILAAAQAPSLRTATWRRWRLAAEARLPTAGVTNAAVPTEAPSTEAPSAGGLAAGGPPARGLPARGLPTGGLPTGGLPAEGLPAEGLPAGGLPAGGLPAGGLPTGELPAEGLPGADLATAAYVLGELTPAQQSALVAILASAAPAVVVVEPGTPAGHRRVLAARTQLIAAGYMIAAPCPHQLRCPLAVEGDWCHFGARLQRSAVHRQVKGVELSYEDEKYSYVTAVRTTIAVDMVRAPGRVVRRPQQRKGLVLLDLCLPDGTSGRELVSKSKGDVYRRARKISWGDRWPRADEG